MIATTERPSIEITSIGPVTEFSYTMEEPGIHVLEGDAGAGKTTILKTVAFADSGCGEKPTKMDGAKAGTAVIGGKTLKINKTVREEGELGFEGLGDLDLAGLHSPKFLGAHTRDAHRIKALARLAGVTADPALFHELFGTREEFDAIVDADAIKTDDLVEMAAKVKRAIEKAAKSEENQADTARTRLLVQSEVYANVDFDAPHNAKVLQEAQVAAIEAKSKVGQQRTNALETITKANDARSKLESASVGAPKVEDATVALAAATDRRCSAESRVQDLERRLTEARHAVELARTDERAADHALRDAKRHEELTAEWRDQIEAAAAVHCPTEAKVTAASNAVDAANAAVALGLKVREALAAKVEAGRIAEVAKAHEQAAKRLRDAAAATQDVLSEAIARIPNCPLKVFNDAEGNSRLVLETDRSEREPFDELSDGERYDVLIPMLARNGRIIVLSQAAFGELSPTIRGRVHELARQRGCYVLTAQADSGPLRAQVYQPETVEAVA